MTESSEITRLLAAVKSGTEGAFDELVGAIYGELERMARSRMVGQPTSFTWTARDLSHEVFLKLHCADTFLKAENSRFLYGAVSEAMRQLLSDQHRRRNAAKRRCHKRMIPLDNVLDEIAANQTSMDAINDALSILKTRSPRQREVIDLKFFAGRQVKEIAEILSISPKTVEKDLQVAKAFLRSKL